MTLEELSRYYKLRKRILRNEKMLKSLEAAVHPGAQLLTGMPHATEIKDKVGDLATEITYLTKRNKELKEEMDYEAMKLNEYILTIDDEQTRTIFQLRFLHCLNWDEVARVIGGNNTSSSVRAICYRYINKRKKSSSTV